MASFYGAHRPPPSVPRTDFGPAPPGYIPGIGRGAVGFTTRSDIGPAKPMQEEQVVGRSRVLPIPPLPLGYGARQGIPTVAPPPSALLPPPPSSIPSSSSSPSPTPLTSSSTTPSLNPSSSTSDTPTTAAEAKSDALDAAKYSDSNYDAFSGYAESLFAGGEYDAEDKEADAIYDAIDRRVDSRRKRRREEKEAEMAKKEQPPQARISSTFIDLKRSLAGVSETEWAAIPESLDHSRHNALLKQQTQKERFTPMPDSIIVGATAAINAASSKHSALSTAVDASLSTPLTSAVSALTPDLTSIGRARDKMLGLKLDRVSDSVGGQTVVDPKGYMTELQSVKVNSAAEVSDIKKARMLLQSVIDSNPALASGYIGLSRLEKDTGRMKEAREAIMLGCERCSHSEDVWIEAALLHPGKQGRAIVAKAIEHLPTSIPLWTLASRLEDKVEDKKVVLRRALELIPNSIGLWKAAIEMEDEAGARVLLSRAVELVPESVDMWLAFARLSSYEEARAILNRARRAVPTDSSIWITAAKLEEANGKGAGVGVIIEKAVKSLQAYEVRMEREVWLNEAEMAERSGAVDTCRAIVNATLGLGVDELDRKNTWTTDAEGYEAKGAYHTARAIHQQLLAAFPAKKSLWVRAVQFEKARGTKTELLDLLQRGVQQCPSSELLWLMYAKEEWTAGRVEEARAILERAHQQNSGSEEIWMAAMKIEFECHELERARALLAHARLQCHTARVWMKSAKLERVLKEDQRERELLDEGLKQWPDAWKLHLMKAQWLQRAHDVQGTREAYKQAIRHCPHVAVLYVQYATFEMSLINQPIAPPLPTPDGFTPPPPPPVSASSALSKARAILESGRLKVPKNPLLWLTSIRIEASPTSSSPSPSPSPSSSSASSHVLAKALQDCPTSGLLHAYAILHSPPPQRKSLSYDALKRCTDDVHVFEAVARLLWVDGKVAKAREWFERGVKVGGGYGDVWVWWYRMEMDAAGGGGETAAEVKRRCVERDPSHGERWTRVSKDDRYVSAKAGEVLQVAARLIDEIVPGERRLAMVTTGKVKKEGGVAATNGAAQA